MAKKFYLHDASSTVAGTLPSATVSSISPTVTATGAGTNRTMNTTIGASQQSGAGTTQANTNSQSMWIRTFLTQPLSAQTISGQSISIHAGTSESNANSDFRPSATLVLWRPSTGSLITRAFDVSTAAFATEPGTTETASSWTPTASSTSLTVVDGDILVLELWRAAGVQQMGVAYTNTVFYDGTTEDSTSTNAAYLLFTNDVLLLGQGYGQANAQIKAIGVTGFGQANAQISKSAGYGQTQAFIRKSAGYANAQGVVAGTSTSAIDTFTRSVTDGLGTADTGGDWTITSGTAANFDVNGTEATIQTATGSATIRLAKVSPNTKSVSLRFRFKLNLIPDSNFPGIVFGLITGSGDTSYTTSQYFMQASYTLGTNTFDLNPGTLGNGALAPAGVTAIANTWYIVEASYVPTSNNKTRIRSKLYQEGTTPTSYTESSSEPVSSVANGHIIGFINGRSADNKPIVSLDDFESISIGWTESGQSQAAIKSKGNGLGQAQGYIRPRVGLGQAHAVVGGSFTSAIDTFTRNVSDDIGTADTGGTWTRTAGTATDADVNGSELTIQTSAISYSSSLNSSLVGPNESLKFRFKVDALPSSTSDIFTLSTRSSANNSVTGARVSYNTSTGNFILRVIFLSNIVDLDTETATANTWYTIETTFASTINGGNKARGKIYTSGSKAYVSGTSAGALSPGHIAININSLSGTLPLVSIDDIEASNASWTESGQAQAKIKAIGNGLGQAQADIKATSRGFGQAAALTSTTVTNVVDTFTRSVSNGWGTTDTGQAWRVYQPTAWSVSGTEGLNTFDDVDFPEAFLDTVYIRDLELQVKFKFGDNGQGLEFYGRKSAIQPAFTFDLSAQTGVIDVTSVSAGQIASVDIGSFIVDTYYYLRVQLIGAPSTTIRMKVWDASSSEPNTWDLTTSYTSVGVEKVAGGTGIFTAHNTSSTITFDNLNVFTYIPAGFGQAQAKISGNITAGSGQAQADIKQTYFGLGQTQADIKARAYGLGQSQADIKATNFGLGQAQADIKAVNFGLGQAQADIKTTYFGLGQSQTDIKQTYYALAQAQADIKTTYFGLGQANAWIEQTYNGCGQAQACIRGNAFAQAQADIKQTYFGLGQSQADIKAVNRGFGQANALITRTSFSSAQAQADIKATGYGSGQAQADIKNTYFGSGQAQADIKNTYFGLGQAQADIKAVGYGFGQANADIKAVGRGFGQAQADIKQTYFAVAQAQADIKNTYYGSGQSQADIKNTYYGHGQANAWIKQTYSQSAQAQADIKAIGFGLGQAQSDIKTTYTQSAQTQADIKQTYYSFGQTQATLVNTYFAFAQAQAKLNAFNVNAFGQTQADIKFEGTVGVGQAQAKLNAFGYNQYGQAQAAIKNIYFGLGQTQADIRNTYFGLAQSQADIKTTYFGLGQANADIKQVGRGFGQAQACIVGWAFAQTQADIKNTYYGLAQAQAKINAFGVNAFAQAQGYILSGKFVTGQCQADIKAKGYGLGQAQADIKTTYTQSGQTQADIKNTYNGCGQANCLIVTTVNKHGQAQADIKQTEYSSGQTQGDIKTTYPQSGQCQADIKQIYTVSGQANCQITKTAQGYGQAQGTVKTTYYQSGNAQADIKISYTVFGQAQGSIKNTYIQCGQANAYIILIKRGYAQAQAEIKNTYTQFAQSQADILNTYNGYANAQGWIKTTINNFGQAQAQITTSSFVSGNAQALITSGTAGFGQAQAQILNTYIQSGQAQADILKLAGYGQAQATIRQDRIIKNLTMSDRHSITVTLIDREVATNTLEEDRHGITVTLSDRAY